MKLVLLDRDGVVNVDRPDSVKSRDEFILLPRVVAAIRLLNDASIPVAIVTNQAVVGRGELTDEGLNDIHTYFQDLLHREGAFINKIYTCTSTDPKHPLRKPNPGLLIEALNDFQVKPHEAVFIGDALRDLQAARAIQCPCVLVCTGKGAQTIKNGLPDEVLPVRTFDHLYDAVSSLLKEKTC